MSDSYILELKLNTKKQSDCNYLDNYFHEAWCYSNTLVRIVRKKLNLLKRDSAYTSFIKEYRTASGNAKKRVGKELHAIIESYGLTKYTLQKVLLDKRRRCRYLHSDVAQKLSDAVYRGVEKCLYENGRDIHFNKYANFKSFENKKNTTGIIYDNGKVYINCTPKRPKGGIILDVILPRNKESAHYIYETTCLCDRTKYCRIVRKQFPGGWKYYVQLVQEGTAPRKYAVGTGRVGIDIGTSSIATASDTACHLDTIGDNVASIEKEIKRLNRKLDRSRRKSNPKNYNADGTIKKGRKTWTYSEKYKHTRRKSASLQRKRAASLKQAQEGYVNSLLSEGNEFYIEKMNFKALQKRKKKKDIVKDTNTNGREKSKKRFGKSIGLRAPAQLVAILKRKAEASGCTFVKVNTQTFKASQYNHVTDTFIKKKLSRRHNTINGIWVQRDVYSAFLLKNSEPDYKHTDRNLCIQNYDEFKTLHDECIENIKVTYKQQNRTIPRSFGIAA